MPPKVSDTEAEARRVSILNAARWCFLNFGFAKTSLDDISKRASISRTLLYRAFRDKQDIFAAVFQHWLVARQPDAQRASEAPGGPCERLLEVCRLMVLEPWADMVGAPMAAEFHEVCKRVDPQVSAHHRRVMLQCVATILDDAAAAEVFLLCLDGLLIDKPTTAALERRVHLLADRFVQPLLQGRRAI